MIRVKRSDKSLNSKRVFYFDIGHTLVTGAAESPRRLLAAALDLNEKETKRVGKLIMTRTCTEPDDLSLVLAESLPSHDPRRIRKVVGRLWADQMECVREIPGATDVIRRIKKAGHGVGLISNIWHPFFEGFRRTCAEILRLSDFVFLSYRRKIKKPDPRLYHAAHEAARRAGYGECWMVGDTYELDIAPAREAGMKGLWILCRPEKEKPLLAEILNGRKPLPDGCVESLPGVIDFLCERKIL